MSNWIVGGVVALAIVHLVWAFVKPRRPRRNDLEARMDEYQRQGPRKEFT